MSTQTQFDRLRVVLVNSRNPLNIGAAARAMNNFGCLHLRVVNPYELAFREARSAVGALPLLASAEEFSSVAEAVADCTLVVGTTALSRRDSQHPVRLLDQAAGIIRKRLASSRVALLFGSEKRGLSNEELSHCHWLLRIPTRDEQRSMNLGQAVAVCLYELTRGSKTASRSEKPLAATSGDLERLTSVLLDTLRTGGHLNPIAGRPPKPPHAFLSEEKVRRLVRRLNLSSSDAEIFLGMLRQMLWKLRSGGDPSV